MIFWLFLVYRYFPHPLRYPTMHLQHFFPLNASQKTYLNFWLLWVQDTGYMIASKLYQKCSESIEIHWKFMIFCFFDNSNLCDNVSVRDKLSKKSYQRLELCKQYFIKNIIILSILRHILLILGQLKWTESLEIHRKSMIYYFFEVFHLRRYLSVQDNLGM